MQILEVGKPFELFYGKNMQGKNGCIMEAYPDGGYGLIVYLDKMTSVEKEILRFNKIQVKTIKETDSFLLTLLKFANSNLYFEIDFDPCLYKDNRMNKMLKSNILDIVGVDSNNNLIQTLRRVSTPIKLYNVWLTAWGLARTENNFSE